MASKVFEQIFVRHIAQFVGYFIEDSSIIFKDEKNNLIHPGEYGKYREDACKDLLRLILDKHVNISDGFVITANNTITTQCDVIVYNADASPIIADGIARMFPVEEVRMIGEIKSTLSKKEYIDALRKMAMNKKNLLEGRRGEIVKRTGRESDMYNTIISFLVCSKLDFAFSTLTYDEIYEGIDRKYWHNTILSLEDGVSNYLLRFQDFSPEVKEEFKKNGVNPNVESVWHYPWYKYKDKTFLTQPHYIHMQESARYEHIKRFCLDITSCCKDVWTYCYDPIVYLGMDIKEFYIN